MTDRPAPGPPLVCPHCGGALGRDGPTWTCRSGHSFDVARQGYVNLLVARPGSRPTGDDAAMLDARRSVHEAGVFRAVEDAVVMAVDHHLDPGARVVVEVGAGNGHWLDRVRRAADLPVAVALDASTAAARRAARVAHVTAVVADAWATWPLADDAVDLVLNVFAPRNLDEVVRVLAPGGTMVSVVPGADHLGEVAGPLGMLAVPDHRGDEVVADAGPGLVLRERVRVRSATEVARATLVDLAAMGPTGHHRDRAGLARVAATLPDPATVTVDCHVLVLGAGGPPVAPAGGAPTRDRRGGRGGGPGLRCRRGPDGAT